MMFMNRIGGDNSPPSPIEDPDDITVDRTYFKEKGEGDGNGEGEDGQGEGENQGEGNSHELSQEQIDKLTDPKKQELKEFLKKTRKELVIKQTLAKNFKNMLEIEESLELIENTIESIDINLQRINDSLNKGMEGASFTTPEEPKEIELRGSSRITVKKKRRF